MTVKKVFIAGSRSILRLNVDILCRIDNIIEKGFLIIIGDANGIDKAVQHYLKSKNYSNVLIYCMDAGCRNNIGNWPKRVIKASNSNRRDFTYYSTKDRAMADEADYGLMLWDGKSRGTLTNIVDLLKKEIPVVLYIGHSFYTLQHLEQLDKISNHYNHDSFRKIIG